MLRRVCRQLVHLGRCQGRPTDKTSLPLSCRHSFREYSEYSREMSYIVECRKYTIQPTAFQEFVELVKHTEELRRSLMPVMGMFVSDLGEALNTFVHLYKYRDLDHRDEVRARAKESVAWKAYLDRAKPMFVTQESSVLRPVPEIMAHASPSDCSTTSPSDYTSASFSPGRMDRVRNRVWPPRHDEIRLD